MSRFSVTAIALLVAVGVCLPSEAEAQGGIMRRLKEKAEQTITSTAGPSTEIPASTTSTSAQHSRTAAESVPPITSDVLARFHAGLAAEQEDRAEVVRLLAPGVSERFSQCVAGPEVAQETLRLIQEFAHRFEGSNAQAAAAEYEAALGTMVSQKCGPDPTRPDELRRRPNKVGREAAGLEEREYALLKERTLPFCSNAATAGRQVPGQGRNIFYVYSESEVEVLRPRCGDLLPLLQAGA